MFTKKRYLLMVFVGFITFPLESAFTSLLSKVRVKALNAAPIPSIKVPVIHANTYKISSGPAYQFPKIVSRYDLWPTAFINLRDLVYGKYNFVHESFAPFIGKGIVEDEVKRFPKQYINVPYVEKPVPYVHGWQVTNRTLLKTIIDQTANKYDQAYNHDEQRELVEIALEKGADPLYDPAIESDSEGFNAELNGNALEIAIKLKNLGALEAIMNHLS